MCLKGKSEWLRRIIVLTFKFSWVCCGCQLKCLKRLGLEISVEQVYVPLHWLHLVWLDRSIPEKKERNMTSTLNTAAHSFRKPQRPRPERSVPGTSSTLHRLYLLYRHDSSKQSGRVILYLRWKRNDCLKWHRNGLKWPLQKIISYKSIVACKVQLNCMQHWSICSGRACHCRAGCFY